MQVETTDRMFPKKSCLGGGYQTKRAKSIKGKTVKAGIKGHRIRGPLVFARFPISEPLGLREMGSSL